MFNILIKCDLLRQLVEVSVDPHPYIAASLGVFKELFMASFTAAHDRSQQLDPGLFRQRHDLIDHLVDRLT